MQKEHLSRLAALTLVLGIALAVPLSADAAPVNGRNSDGSLTAIKQDIKLNSHDSKKASDLAKATHLTRNDISKLMDKGYKEDDSKTVYTVKTFSDDKLDKVFEKYDEVGRDQQKLLEAYKVSSEDFQKKRESLFKFMEDGENHLRDRVKWRKAPFH